MAALPPIVLASASPRRRELLARAGLAFAVEPVDVPEPLGEFSDPVAAADGLARRKARAALAAPRAAGSNPHWFVGADTVVGILGDGHPRLLGKPADPSEAEGMLSALSGTRHAVVTGVCVARSSDGRLFAASETTWVTMRAIEPWELEAYVASDEWCGKAGGYAIQETADRFVTRLEGGGFDNVVGLPVALTLELLRQAGAPGVPAGERG